MIELNCETDFVAKTEAFIRGTEHLLDTLHLTMSDKIFTGKEQAEENFDRLKALNLHTPLDTGVSTQNVEDGIKFLISKVQENCKLGRIYQRKHEENQVFAHYVHNHLKQGVGKIGSVVLLDGIDKPDKGIKNGLLLAQHAAAMNPMYLNAADVPEKVRQEEQAESDKKWQEYVRKYCFAEQELCTIDQSMSVEKFLKDRVRGSTLKNFALFSFQ